MTKKDSHQRPRIDEYIKSLGNKCIFRHYMPTQGTGKPNSTSATAKKPLHQLSWPMYFWKDIIWSEERPCPLLDGDGRHTIVSEMSVGTSVFRAYRLLLEKRQRTPKEHPTDADSTAEKCCQTTKGTRPSKNQKSFPQLLFLGTFTKPLVFSSQVISGRNDV